MKSLDQLTNHELAECLRVHRLNTALHLACMIEGGCNGYKALQARCEKLAFALRGIREQCRQGHVDGVHIAWVGFQSPAVEVPTEKLWEIAERAIDFEDCKRKEA